MKLDKQTLAWFNQDKFWIKIFNPKYQESQRLRSGGGIAENANLPDTMQISQYHFFNRINKRMETAFTNYWGFEKWHHSPQLINNNCKCPRCNFNGKNDKWWFMPMEFWDYE